MKLTDKYEFSIRIDGRLKMDGGGRRNEHYYILAHGVVMERNHVKIIRPKINKLPDWLDERVVVQEDGSIYIDKKYIHSVNTEDTIVISDISISSIE